MVTKTHQKDAGTEENGLEDCSQVPSWSWRTRTGPLPQRCATGHKGSPSWKRIPRSVYHMRVPKTTKATRMSTTTSCNAGQAFAMTCLNSNRTMFRSLPRSALANVPSLKTRNMRTARKMGRTLEWCVSDSSTSPLMPPMQSSNQKGITEMRSTTPMGEPKKRSTRWDCERSCRSCRPAMTSSRNSRSKSSMRAKGTVNSRAK
mmetsp:Transcript_28434/g.90577  ORF Transcript_28434/g.90577 Transcript_28434/m.90577 type:complete len:203 (+) Transcript_28434:718-1326(+)